MIVPYTITALARFDETGLNVVPSAEIYVRDITNTTLATLYTDGGGGATVGQPINADANGSRTIYIDQGRYAITVEGVMKIVEISGSPEIASTAVADYTALLALDPADYAVGRVIMVTGEGLAGPMVVDSGASTDNGGTVKTDSTWNAASKHLRRLYDFIISARWFGAIGDGATNDTAAVANASSLDIKKREYVVTSFSNDLGYDVTPDGICHNHSTGRVYNPTQQKYTSVFGQETLQHWFSRFAGANNKTAGDSTVRTICISGDSTTYGVGATYGTPAALLEDLAEARGYTNVGVYNRRQSGKATFDWVSTYVAGDIATNADLLILRWGDNDPFFGETVEDFIASLRTGLAAVRASKTVQQMSILLMTPVAMNDVEKGRTEVWNEQIGQGIRQAARDYQCAFMDTYAMFQNAHDGVGYWYDIDTSFYPGGRAIHPHDILYEHIMGAVADIIFPQYGTNWKANAFRNCSAGDAASKKTGSELPNTYFAGIDMRRLADGTGSVNGQPYDGVAMTFKQADGATLQFSVPLADGAKGSGISMRLGWNNTWTQWYGAVYAGSGILTSGWANTGGAYRPFSYMLSLEGRCFLNGVINAGTTTDGTTVFTMPVGYRPQYDEILLISTESGTAKILITTAGVAKIYGFGSGGAYISLSGASYKAAV